MKVAPVARLAVPTGTAAASVVQRLPAEDSAIEARRFCALAALSDDAFRGSIEELIVAGVYTVLTDRIVVLRVSASGVQTLAAVVAVHGTPAPRDARAGLFIHPSIVTVAHAPAAHDALHALLDAETKQRPIFHGTTAESVTYSGFEAQSAAEIVKAIESLLAPNTSAAAVAIVVAGAPVGVPEGLFIGLESAPI